MGDMGCSAFKILTGKPAARRTRKRIWKENIRINPEEIMSL